LRKLFWAAALVLLLASPAHADFEFSDIACETTTTTGTGTLSLAGAKTNYISFLTAGIDSGDTVPYHIKASDGKLETGIGTFTDATPDTLARTSVKYSTDGAATKLNLPSGTHTVCIGPIAAIFTGGGSATSWNPTTNDGASLGTSSLQWSDLFLANGGAINWNNGDVTLSATGNSLLLDGSAPELVIDGGTNGGQILFFESDFGGNDAYTLRAPNTMTTSYACQFEDDSSFIPDSCVGNGSDDNTLGPDGDKGDVTVGGTGTTLEIDSGAVGTAEIADGTIAEVDLKVVDTPSDEECLTYETTAGDFEWQSCGAGGGSGDVTGPASSTDNAIARFDGTTGKIIQNSGVTISDTNDISAASLTLTGTPLAVGSGGTGQTTEAEALGEMTQALTEDTAPDYTADFVMTYDASADTGKKVKLQNLRGAGEFFWWTAGSTCPAYSLKADGSLVSRTTYSRLWNAVSAIAQASPDAADYGTGDGSTTFRLPDLTTGSQFIRAGTFGTAQASGAPNITGDLTTATNRRVFTSGTGAFSLNTATNASGTSTTNSAAANVNFNASSSNSIYGAATEIRPPNVAWTPCIVF